MMRQCAARHGLYREKGSRQAWWLAAAVLAAALGCHGAGTPETAAVQGKVTYQGKPITQGVILLTPEAGGQAAIGEIQADGSFQLTTFKKNDGARPGKYRVAVQPSSSGAAVPGMEFAGGKPPIPAKYLDGSTSGLTAEIKPGKNTLDLPLKD